MTLEVTIEQHQQALLAMVQQMNREIHAALVVHAGIVLLDCVTGAEAYANDVTFDTDDGRTFKCTVVEVTPPEREPP